MKCLVCGKRIKEPKKNFCSRKCSGIYYSNKNNPLKRITEKEKRRRKKVNAEIILNQYKKVMHDIEGMKGLDRDVFEYTAMSLLENYFKINKGLL
jgi:predicted nucleic acid-binding Zn ribbon protein